MKLHKIFYILFFFVILSIAKNPAFAGDEPNISITLDETGSQIPKVNPYNEIHIAGTPGVIIRVINSSGAPVTGLTGTNIKFKETPYSGSYLTGLTVTEIGVQGNYKVTGFDAVVSHAYSIVKLYINDVEQTWWGEQWAGNPFGAFATLYANETIAGVKTWTGANIHSGNENFNGTVSFNSSAVFASGQTVLMSGTSTTINNPLVVDPDMTPVDANLICKKYADANYKGSNLVRKIIVNGDQTDTITGKLHKTIRGAIDYIHTYGGTLSNTNRWTIEVHGKGNGAVYDEDFIWYSYIDIIGIGNVKIQNHTGLSIWTRSGSALNKMQNCILIMETNTLNLDYAMFENCAFISIDIGGDFGVFAMQFSQFKACDFNFTLQSGYFTSNGNNKILGGCISNGDLGYYWQSTDKVFNLSYIDGVNIDY